MRQTARKAGKAGEERRADEVTVVSGTGANGSANGSTDFTVAVAVGIVADLERLSIMVSASFVAY